MSYSTYNEFQNLCEPSRIVTSSYKFIPKNTCTRKNAYFNVYRYPYIYHNPAPYVQPINYINEQAARLADGPGEPPLEFQTTSNQFKSYNPELSQVSDEAILNTKQTEPGTLQILDTLRSFTKNIF
jgi:hypothetical protein